jgi:hypothetical protein
MNEWIVGREKAKGFYFIIHIKHFQDNHVFDKVVQKYCLLNYSMNQLVINCLIRNMVDFDHNNNHQIEFQIVILHVEVVVAHVGMW